MKRQLYAILSSYAMDKSTFSHNYSRIMNAFVKRMEMHPKKWTGTDVETTAGTSPTGTSLTCDRGI
eukprot:8375360-Karenia_brevis.AAC.1